jgi:GntR family transcriptional repressor for pyruvate dehydrogenase complex
MATRNLGPASRDGRPPMPGRAVRLDKVSDRVAREIVHDISQRRLAAGVRLPSEASMLATYQVSRASLREALRILEVNGLITVKPGVGGGPVVTAVSSREFGRMATLFFRMSGTTLRELVQARLVLEPVMAGLAARRRGADTVKRLRALIDETRAVSTQDDATYIAISTRFHEEVAGLSGNRILDHFAGALKHIYTDRVSGLVFPSPERVAVLSAHEAIAEAIIAGDAPRAERLMRRHMEEFADNWNRRYPGLLEEVLTWG